VGRAAPAQPAAAQRPITGPRPGMPDPGPTEHVPDSRDADATVPGHSPGGRPPPPPPVSEPSWDRAPLPEDNTVPGGVPQGMSARAPQAHRPSPDVTAPDAPMPAHVLGAAQHRQTQQLTQQQRQQPPPPAVADFQIPESADVPHVVFSPQFLAEELVDDDSDDPPWSLVQRLVRPTNEKSKNALVEIVHYRGESVVDHTVIHEGETFRLGDSMTRAERRERGVPKVIPIVRLKKGGVAEVFIRDGVSGRLLRGGQQQDLASAPGVSGQQAVPITDGELASLKVGNERLFVRFAGAPQLLWTREDAAEDLFARRLTGISIGSAVGLFLLMAVVSWIYQYRNADSEVIALEDEGFAEVELKELKMEEPPPEPEKPPEPIAAEEPTPQPDQPKPTQAAKSDDKPAPAEPTPKPGVLDILNSIPKVQDTASSQNLEALTSNIKAVRVPGAASGFKTSALVGKGPSSGVQIGGAAGGLSTSGINSVLRKDGAAGAMGGKGERAVSGKVTTLTRQFKREGQGELSKEEIMRVINANIGQIQYCYEKALRTQPGLSGRVVLEWTVNTSGKVTVVKVAQSSLASNDATRCMMDKLRGWKFPQPKGGNVTIVFPFVFNTV
jgi:TonB family protein